jgi:trehalose synthase
VIKIEDYREVAPRGAVDLMLRLAERVRGRRFLHVGSTRFGGGAAELLQRLVPIMSELGIDASWEVVGGDAEFFATARAIAGALGGQDRVVTPAMFERYLERNRVSASKLALDGDLVLVHDAGPASLVTDRAAAGKWVWRCHADLSAPRPQVWGPFSRLLARYDAAVFSLPSFAQRLPIPQFIVHPSIDPLSDKNRELGRREVRLILESLRVPQDKPLLLQIGSFDRDRDPVGVVRAYRIVKRHHDVRLVLAGSGSDGPEGAEVFEQLREAAARDPDILVLDLPPDAQLQINALQRASCVVLQKSIRDEFAIGAAEAMWKSKPVIGGAVGGLPAQVAYDVTGYIVNSVEGAAFWLRHLLSNPELITRMGAVGREHVRRNFLITRHLSDYLALLVHLTGQPA